MNKSVIKSFAISARKKLIEQVKQQAFAIGITATKNTELIEVDGHIILNGIPQEKSFKQQRDKLIQEIDQKEYEQVMEEVAYIWFNRFIALRFMEINDYLPNGVRVLSSIDPQKAEPDIIREALNIDLDVDRNKVYDFQDKNDTEGLYKYLLIHQCNALSNILPFMFEKIADFTELLFPGNILQEGSVIRDLVTSIDDADWQEVEIIGWLYQYYISEKKDEVIQAKKKYKKEEIPFATQLFTPKWIVRYMVQNSLGRYWLESHPEQSELKSDWEFYLENPETEKEFEAELMPYLNKELRVEDIKAFDPACGSGHILVYIFDVLYEIYKKCGYLEEDIPKLIVEKNLYGLDIDDRAYQLACFAVVMKATSYYKGFLNVIKREGIKLNIASIQETDNLNNEDIEYFTREKTGRTFNAVKNFIELFKEAKIYGSLIKVDDFDKELLLDKLNLISQGPADNIFDNESREKMIRLMPKLIHQAEIMNGLYDVLITNPPYMGSKYMCSNLGDFAKTNYPETKSDLFSAFLEYCPTRVINTGHLAFVTPFVWMFISSYENLRKKLINNATISSLIQLEYNAFEAACVPVCTFTLRNNQITVPGEFIKLSDFTGIERQPIKTLEAISNPSVSYRYTSFSSELNRIPGSPIAYWVNERIRKIFQDSNSLGKMTEPRQGMATADNNRFLRCWTEVNINNIGFAYSNRQAAKESRLKWFPYNKGGDFRKWYGNNEYVVNWENDGLEIKNFKDDQGKVKSRPQNLDCFFRKGITWNLISSTNFGVRCFPVGMIFDIGSHSVFCEETEYNYFAGLLNTNIVKQLLQILNPTLNFSSGVIANIPVILSERYKPRINQLVKQNILNSRTDWDSFETSWDFKQHPLLTYKKDAHAIEQAFINWAYFSETQFNQLKGNEEELNRIFIEIYGLQDAFIPEVLDKDVTICKANRERDIKSFISYAVGCMLGRYSLNEEDLIFAGGSFDPERYKIFQADEDGILPILDDAYFDDDIVFKFVEFVKVTFGENTLAQNLDYIAETLGRKVTETSKECIRRYFIKDFYKDHVHTYKKRPIYWLFTSGKEQGFNALMYLHRYDSSTISRVRTDYLHQLQNKLEAEFMHLNNILISDDSIAEKSKATKKLKVLTKQMEELKKYDEVIHHVADQQIELDLDDGVVANYAKLESVLAKI